MDTGEMRELLNGYLGEMSWAGGASKDDLLEHLAGRDDALRTMVNEYVAEGTYRAADEVLSVIPAQAWQDAQGDAWRGAEIQYAEDVNSGFRDSPVGQPDDVYHAGGPRPATPGFGRSAVENAGTGSPAGGSAADGGTEFGTPGLEAAGLVGGNEGAVDPGVSGRNQTTGS